MLLEDIGAEIGLFMALAGVLLAHFTDEPRWDAVGSIGIGVLLVVIAIDAGGRDEGPAHRRVGVARATSTQINAALDRHAARCAASSTCGPSTSVPTSCSSPPRSSSTRRSSMAELAAAIDAAEAALRAGRADRQAHLHRARHPPVLATPTPASPHGGNVVTEPAGSSRERRAERVAAATDPRT